MKKARLSVRSIVLHDIDHCSWNRLNKHVHTKVRFRVWDNLGHPLVDQYLGTITDTIRNKS
jgi:hypothetical protein